MIDVSTLDFTKGNGLVSVIAQDARTGAVLMIAFADREAIERTAPVRASCVFSRSRGPWHKGATSGNVLRVRALIPDCDADAVLAMVEPAGPACHTGTVSCFGEITRSDALSALDATIADRMRPDAAVGTGYTQKLLKDRNLRLKKIGEEASELVTACADNDVERATEETADLVYHALVALRAVGGSLDGVRAVLAARAP